MLGVRFNPADRNHVKSLGSLLIVEELQAT